MAHTKRITIMKSPPYKKAKSLGGVKFTSPSSSPPTSPLSSRPVSNFPSCFFSRPPPPLWPGRWPRHAGSSNPGPERINSLGTPQGGGAGARASNLHLESSNYQWDVALLDQDLKRAQAERDVAD
ncbi:hypothetical protein LIER_16141 [Lithospermum erythrorhizon]|uniref:Uncharacterized protein n=1 Tax=Lithospermum erythrorhizon TaxID=34254 RepID=A0AAV3QAW8_LITER